LTKEKGWDNGIVELLIRRNAICSFVFEKFHEAVKTAKADDRWYLHLRKKIDNSALPLKVKLLFYEIHAALGHLGVNNPSASDASAALS
jgi:hypothetical protein